MLTRKKETSQMFELQIKKRSVHQRKLLYKIKLDSIVLWSQVSWYEITTVAGRTPRRFFLYSRELKTYLDEGFFMFVSSHSPLSFEAIYTLVFDLVESTFSQFDIK